MIISFEISDTYVPGLCAWASVGRTLDNAVRVANAIGTEVTEDDKENAQIIIQELKEIGPALDHLHQMARSEIWKQFKAEILAKT